MDLLNKIVEKVIGSSRTSHYFIYPRNKDGKRTGQTICVLLHDGRIFHGISTCSKDDQFSRETGRDLAVKRAQDCVKRFELRKGK